MKKNQRFDAGFSLIEIMVVVTILGVLMSLGLAISNYVREKSKRSLAEVEVSAMRSACESYKNDQSAYPRTNATDGLSGLDPDTNHYREASRDLYIALSGDTDLNGVSDAYQGVVPQGKKTAEPVYMDFKPNMLRKKEGVVFYLKDPWDAGDAGEKPYGYSTKRAKDPSNAEAGYNVTYDLWSTAGKPENPKAWISNR